MLGRLRYERNGVHYNGSWSGIKLDVIDQGVKQQQKDGWRGMAWRSWVFETMTGVIHAPIDLPKFAWSVDVSDSSLATLKDKGVGDLDLSGCDGAVGVGAGRHDAGQTPHPHPRTGTASS